MKSFFPFVAHVSDTPPPLWRDENSTEPARNIGFLKYNSHVLLCAGFLLLLAPAWYLLSCGRGALARRLRRRRHGQRPGHWQVGHHVILDKESIPPASRTYQCRKWKIMEEPVGNDGDFAGSLQPTGFLDGVHEHAPQAPGRQLPIARTGSPYQVTKQSYFGFQIYRAYRFKHCVETVVT